MPSECIQTQSERSEVRSFFKPSILDREPSTLSSHLELSRVISTYLEFAFFATALLAIIHLSRRLAAPEQRGGGSHAKAGVPPCSQTKAGPPLSTAFHHFPPLSADQKNFREHLHRAIIELALKSLKHATPN